MTSGLRLMKKTVAFAVACCSAPFFPAWAQMDRTTPGHMPPVPPGGYELPLAPPVMRFPLPPQWVVIRSNQDWRKAGGKMNKKLSDACALGHFGERLPMRFRAVFQRDVFGVAFGHGLNLVDPKKLADRKMIYIFRNGDSTACQVMEMTNKDAKLLAQEEGAPPPQLPGPDGKVPQNPAKRGY
jgi:hypothetical protein